MLLHQKLQRKDLKLVLSLIWKVLKICHLNINVHFQFLLSIFGNNKMELLQSQAPAKRELLGSSVIRTWEFGNWTFDLRIWSLDIGVWTWEPLLNLFRTSLEPLLSIFLASFDSYDYLSTWLTLSSCCDSVAIVLWQC